MTEGQKYNSFSGVFTPSILTILGVIMYMRLGWIVGEAGLIAALAIIALSHVISITTGLSISSIATDKKIKTGGIYYILSRSLGMPMGGAIGIALFLGTALSISLYIVGFAESFLAIDAIRDFTGLAADINGFRIIGTIIIIILVIIAFISTSLAMKMQFFILIAIGLSLLSIILGFIDQPSISTSHLSLSPTGNIPIEYIFAIFFPAVTGFTAGVAMSGDLKDPKKNIPGGTIMAISVGFVIYVLLAVGMAYFIPREDLISDYNILSKIAWLGPLVIAGIWGATLSSALGGILGGPRILQAIAKDRMAPKFFGIGYGEGNEPRNALLFIFAIAEGGILIGQLDVIAGVVSMFYLASYGFINLSYVLEKWSSSDFRPSFKIHIAFGIVGFISSFAVMFKLDMVSMFASLLIMALLYFILKRREIKSENGDVWTSVWASIMRRALASMEGNKLEERNWKPNIILFSGGTKKRPHLLSFGKSLIGKYGMVTNFDLHEQKENKVLFTKYEQAVKDTEDKDRGVFTRKQSCNNIYEGIEMISQTYGFSGVEPNTILMGWGRETRNPIRFVQMLNNISNLDLNILLMDYDKTNGFGEKKQIDIWWRGSGTHGNLSLTLIKFLSNSEDWSQAKIRLLIVNYENNKMEMITKRAEEHLENSRIDAELKVINNEIEQKPFYDIMKTESHKSDLVFLGIPEIKEGKEHEFVKSTNDLMLNVGSVVLVKASSLFKELQLGVNQEVYKNEYVKELKLINKKIDSNIEIKWPNNLTVAHELRQLNKKQFVNFEQHLSSIYYQIEKDNASLLENCESDYLQSINSIESSYSNFNKDRKVQLTNKLRGNVLSRLNKQIEQFSNEQLKEQSHLLETHLPIFLNNLISYFEILPTKVIIKYSLEDLQKQNGDSGAQKRYKWRKRIWAKKETKYKLLFKRIIEEQISFKYEPFLLDHFKHFGLMQVQFAIELLKVSKQIDSSFINISDAFKKEADISIIFRQQKELINKEFLKLKQLNKIILESLNDEFISFQAKQYNSLTGLFNQVHPNSLLLSDDEEKPKKQNLKPILDRIPQSWARNQKLVYNASTTEIRLLSLKSKIKTTIYKLAKDVRDKIQTDVINFYENYLLDLENKNSTKDWNDLSSINLKTTFDNYYEESYRTFNRSFANFPEHIKIFESEKLNNYEHSQFNNIESSDIAAKQLVDYLIKNKIESPLNKHQEILNRKISESISRLNESKRLIAFAKSHDIDADELDIEELPHDVLEEGKNKIKQELDFLKKFTNNIEFEADTIYTDMSQVLSFYSFVKTASNLKQYISQQKSLSKFEKVKDKFKDWYLYIKEHQANLIYSQSKAFILKSKLSESKQIQNPVKALLDITYQLTPKKESLKKLPFYYKQLFTSNHILHKDFWVGREKEIERAKTAFKRYKSGYKGAIAVTGLSGVGKSFFSYYISNFSDTAKVLTISPFFETEPTLDDLTKAFQKAADQNSNIQDILKKLPTNTVIIFEHIESWGINQYSKNNITQYIFELINDYLDQFIFILNANTVSFKEISQNTMLSNLFIDVIELENIDSKQLKKIVLNRHNTSGLKLKLDGKLFHEHNESKLARLFNKIHKVTKGNIEASLQLWLSLINDYENETINIESPKININNFNVLDMDSKIILKQFVVHKRLTTETLTNILKEDTNNVKQKIQFLIRSGLIIKQKNYYKQNSYTKYYVNEFLRKKGLL